tara:strand:- start:340 stop:576 length:237 start_codon:yes stop_codon:yes gene_type:complete
MSYVTNSTVEFKAYLPGQLERESQIRSVAKINVMKDFNSRQAEINVADIEFLDFHFEKAEGGEWVTSGTFKIKSLSKK